MDKILNKNKNQIELENNQLLDGLELWKYTDCIRWVGEITDTEKKYDGIFSDEMWYETIVKNHWIFDVVDYNDVILFLNKNCPWLKQHVLNLLKNDSSIVEKINNPYKDKNIGYSIYVKDQLSNNKFYVCELSHWPESDDPNIESANDYLDSIPFIINNNKVELINWNLLHSSKPKPETISWLKKNWDKFEKDVLKQLDWEKQNNGLELLK